MSRMWIPGETMNYIGNKSTKVLHHLFCRAVKWMEEKNKKETKDGKGFNGVCKFCQARSEDGTIQTFIEDHGHVYRTEKIMEEI